MSRLFLLSLLLAHLAADFPLQTASLCEKKYSGNNPEKMLGLTAHTLIHFLTGFLLSVHFLWSPRLFIFLLLYAGSHFIIDAVKTRSGTDTLSLFFLDQFVHLLAILLLTSFFELNLAPWWNSLFSYLSSTAPHNVSGIDILTRALTAIILFILGVWATGVFIRIYIRRLKGNTYAEESGAVNGGYLIGVLERLFVITAVATNNASWAGLILGVKSIARFQKFKEDDAFVEYFLIGSFISLFTAFLIGFTIQRYLLPFI